MSKVRVYTDGACSGNPGPGGWAAVIIYGNKEVTVSGGEENTTNNRMELLATIKGIEEIGRDIEEIDLYTDSKYVKDGITTWIHNWKKNCWRTANKKPVKNIDLWQYLDKIILNKIIQWHWVKGHSGDKYNDLVDNLAVEACSSIKKECVVYLKN